MPPPKPTTTQSDDVTAILAIVQDFTAAIKTKSRDEFEKCCFTAGGMALSGPKTSLRFVTLNAFINWIITTPAEFDEQIGSPQAQVYEGSNLATVLAPFRAKIDGNLDHVGVDLFILHKIEGKWKISGVADSCQYPTNQGEGYQWFDWATTAQVNITSGVKPRMDLRGGDAATKATKATRDASIAGGKGRYKRD
jgi:hypothetical protein